MAKVLSQSYFSQYTLLAIPKNSENRDPVDVMKLLLLKIKIAFKKQPKVI